MSADRCTREDVIAAIEAGATAIVTYLNWRRKADHTGLSRAAIDSALQRFWLERARTARRADALDGF